jgi:putative protein-disulfide isomerase
MTSHVRITAFTDPACTWCWGSEPSLRAVETRYGAQVSIRPVMGGLVKDIRAFLDSANGIGGDPGRSNAAIAAHWLEASARHGMPVQAHGFGLFTAQDTSTWPICEAYLAARLQDEVLAGRYLRRLREATAAEARQTNRLEVQVELATEVGLDVSRFLVAMRDGTAREALVTDLAETRRAGVRGFPAFLFEGERRALVPGWMPFEGFREVLGLVSGGRLVETAPQADPKAIADFIRRQGRVADREVTVAFGLTEEAWSALQPEVLAQEGLSVEAAGNGRFLRGRSAPAPGTCDPVTGACSRGETPP